MIDKEELLRIAALLSKSSLNSDVTVAEVDYKAGDSIPAEVILEVNRFALKSVVGAYDSSIESEYNSTKNYFQRQKKKLKDAHEE
jgi:DNA-directed RNA polymerase subunit beta